MGETITIRPFRADDTARVIDLLRLALGETPVLRRSPALLNWKHRDNPFGPSVMLVAETGGELVGLRAFMRWDLAVAGGGVVPCGRAVDTATHPGHRRKGIFRALTTQALEAAREAGIRLVFNTPNDKSRPGYLKMGWRDVGPVRVMVRPRLGRVAASRDGLLDPRDALPGATAVDVAGLPSEAPTLDGYPRGVTTRRSPEYLEWRYRSHPTARYATVADGSGAVVLRANVRDGRSEVVVSDVLGTDPGAVLRQAARMARARYLVGTFPAGSRARSLAARAGFVPVPRVAALNLVAHPLDDLPFDPFDPAAWRFVFGDLELL